MNSLLSATSLKAFRACPRRFQLAYVEKIRKVEKQDALRIGTNWGELHVMYNDPSQGVNKEQFVLDYLNKRYQITPNGKDFDDWEVEKLTLLTCLIGYYEYWKDDPIEVDASEQPFEFQVGGHRVAGKIDHIGTWQDRKCLVERKSTSKSLEPDSDYWDVWSKDLQISLYMTVLPPDTAILLDVWRKPTIKQKQKEAPQQYAERLAADIAERPTHYFARRELTRTAVDHRTFLQQLKNMERNISYMEKTNTWYPNESSCYDPYKCDYVGICHGSEIGAVLKGETPSGFVRLTNKGKDLPSPD
jgi:hypothetical protein